MSTILVTGGDGFIGGHLVRALCEQGDRILVVDDHSSSVPKSPAVAHVLEQDVAELHLNDLPRVSHIVHLASPAAPHLFDQDPMAVVRPNTIGTTLMVDLALRDSARLIFASTSEVYGHGKRGVAFREDQPVTHDLLSGRSVYSASKRLGEEIVEAGRGRGLDGMSVRLFNVFGPDMDPTMGTYARVIPNFIRAALVDQPLPIDGDGTQVRSFTWIDDVVCGLLKLMEHTGPLPTVVNLGHDVPTSVADLGTKVEAVLGVRVGRRHRPRPPGDPNWRQPNLARLEGLLGWRPTTSLEDGLRLLCNAEASALAG